MANAEPSGTRIDEPVDGGAEAQLDGTLKHDRSVEEVARELAAQHMELDPAALFYWDSSAHNAVRLVEVSPAVADTGEVLAYRFSASPDFDVLYDFYLALVSPGEWKRVLEGRLKLPVGWGEPKEFRRLPAS